ncbi:hypothetical protein ACJZ2D_010308 [Fusarium nematophilum]
MPQVSEAGEFGSLGTSVKLRLYTSWRRGICRRPSMVALGSNGVFVALPSKDQVPSSRLHSNPTTTSPSFLPTLHVENHERPQRKCAPVSPQRQSPEIFDRQSFGGTLHVLPRWKLLERSLLCESTRPSLQRTIPSNVQREKLEPDDAETEDFSRTIAGAFVQFEDGGRVSKICLPSDFSAVHLSGFPHNTTPQTVHRFLAENGFDIPEKDIWVMRQDGVLSANVRAEDPDFSKKLCALMQTGFTWGTSLIKATPVAARMPSGHTAGRVDCKKVHVSWHKAVRTVWLNFGNGDIAGRVSHKFATGAYTVLGQKVLASPPSQAPTSVFRPYNPLSWTVRLTDVPGSAGPSSISCAILAQGDKPRHIEIGAPGYSIDDEQAAATVRSLLTRTGPVEYWEVKLKSTGKRVKATARFLDDTGAENAVSQLNGKELPFHSDGKLTVQRVYSAKFKVRSDIYNAVVSRASAHADAWKRKHVFFREHPSTRILKVEGESKTEVASAKSVLNSILGGVVAKDGQVSLWDGSLKRNGELWRLVKQKQQDLGVVVVRDKSKEQLRLFGTERKCSEAQRQLAAMFRKEASAYVIELDSAKLHWACRGGFNTIAGKLGPDKAALDVVSPPKIVISGSWGDYDIALALVNGRKLVGKPTTSIAAAREDCSVCWTEADTPVQTECGHVYCQDCFEKSCAVPSTSGGDFALLCHGDQGKCQHDISLQDMHKHLSSALFEDVLERSFTSSVRHAPNKLRFCPTPDCGYVYRVTESARTHTCSNCLQPTCSACHEPHANITCAEYKDIQSGGYAALEKLKKDAGIKDCPKCGTPIEKTAGCNHMTCLGCSAHICWACMKVFASAGLVYEHMGRMHGGHIDL